MLIGITGKSGEGKSTFTRILTEFLPRSKAIHCDDIVNPILLSQKDRLVDIYSNDIIRNGMLNSELFLQYPEKVKTIHHLIDDLVYKEILSQITSSINEKDFVLIDWFRLHEFESLRDICNIHILVKSIDAHKRYEHLSQRHANPKSNSFALPSDLSLERFKLLDQISSGYDRFSYEYIVINNYDESLFTEGKRIAAELQTLNL